MLTPERQRYFSEIISEVLQGSSHTRDELRSICESHGMTDAEAGSIFHSWGGGIRELCERGFTNYTVQEEKEFCLAPSFSPIPEEEAKLEIARRYFTHIAPAAVKKPLMKSASADSERFCHRRKFENHGNTGCISCFSNCTDGAKDPLFSRRRFIQRFL